MVTREKYGIVKPNHVLNLVVFSSTHLHVVFLAVKEPKGFKSASKHQHWYDAMAEKINALDLNNTWAPVPHLTNANLVGSKWVFGTKYIVDKMINRNKGRLVAKGFT